MNKIIPVSCAIIFWEGKVLSVRRSPEMTLAGYWEFPGGKLEKGEFPEECLVREIREELSLEIDLCDPLPESNYSYTKGVTIRLIPFTARIKQGELNLLEHDNFRWLGANELFDLNWAAADIPIVNYVKDHWSELLPIIN